MKNNLSIIIPTYKRQKLALALAQSIRKFHKNIEIIIVEQEAKQSPDKKLIDKFNIRYINLEKANSSTAKNKGIDMMVGDIVVFFDDDIEITKNTIEAHLRAYDDSNIVAVAGRVINDEDKVPRKTDVETGKTNFLGTNFVYKFWSTKKQLVDFVYGCNMSFKRSVLKNCGGFDSLFPKIFEELDVSKRISKYGKIVFQPEALVYHHKAKIGGTRIDKEINRQKTLFYYYGQYLAKNIYFPFSIFSFLVRTATVLKKSPRSLTSFTLGFFKYLFTHINWVLLGILGMAAFLRFYKIPDFFNFTLAEEMQAFLSWEIVKNFHLVWINVSAAYVKYYYGPGFLYLNSLLFFINRDPVILGYFCFFWSIITISSLYFITKDLFDKKTALLTTVIYGASTLINFHDRRFWTPTPIPFVTIWLIYSIIKAHKNTRWYILTAILVGAMFHLHLSLFLLLPAAAISIFLNIKKIKWRTWVAMIAVYFLLTSPLIVFDFVHNFDNLLMPVRTLIGSQRTELEPFSLDNTLRHAHSVFSTMGRIWYLKLKTTLHDEVILESHFQYTNGNVILSLLSLTSLIWFFWKNRKPGYGYFFISLLIIPISYIIYPSANPEYYLLSFITLTTIAIGFFLRYLPTKIAVIIVALFLIANTATILTASDKYGLIYRKRLVKKTMEFVGNNSFYLDVDGELDHPKKYYPYAGWRFLFKAYGKTPSQSSIDQVFGWVYGDEISKDKPDLKVIVVDTLHPKYIERPLKVIKSGIYYAYIFKNK